MCDVLASDWGYSNEHIEPSPSFCGVCVIGEETGAKTHNCRINNSPETQNKKTHSM